MIKSIQKIVLALFIILILGTLAFLYFSSSYRASQSDSAFKPKEESNQINAELFSIDYNPDQVVVSKTYLPDLPVETIYGPCEQYGQEYYAADKQRINASKTGSECIGEHPCGIPSETNLYCRIEQFGDVKGRLQIADIPVDGEWVDIRYTFYIDDYKVDVHPYNQECGDAPCSHFRRWDGKGKLVTINQIIDAFTSNTELNYSIETSDGSVQIVDFQEVKNLFTTALESIQVQEQ